MNIKETIINFLIIFFSIFILFIFLNFALFFSIKHVRQDNISKKLLSLLPIEMTYFYADTYNELKDVNIILGDSHAFGDGDSYLNDDYNWSVGHMLYKISKKNFINVGFPGGGSQKIYKNYLNFKKKTKILPKRIIYFFYEGNDLENDIIYTNNYNSKIITETKIRYYFPLYIVIKNLIDNFVKPFTIEENKEILKKIRKYLYKFNGKDIFEKKITNKIHFKDKIEIINETLQAPPIELSERNINDALNILFEILNNLKNDTNEIIVVYIPAPTTILKLKNPIYFQKYFNNNNLLKSNNIELEKVSKLIRFKIGNFSYQNNIKFLDTTSILKKKSMDLKIYGPKDRKHFNKNGYKIIANEIYKNLDFIF